MKGSRVCTSSLEQSVPYANGSGKRGRKRKSAAQEADEPEPEPEVARVIEAPEPWRTPVAQMI
jgi:hypothetical protein